MTAEQNVKTQSAATGPLATLSALLRVGGSGAPTTTATARAGRVPALLGGVALALAATLLLAAAPALAAAPTVTIQPAAEVGFTTAQAKGTVDPAAHNTGYRFDFATQAQWEANGDSFNGAFTPGPGGNLAENSGEEEVEPILENLTAATTYHLRLYAENDQGEPAEAIAASTFTTQAATAPTLAVNAPEPSYLKAHLSGTVDPEGGNVNPIGGPLPIAWQLQFSLASEPGNWQLAGAGTIEGTEAETSAPIEVTGVAGETFAPPLQPGSAYATRLLVNYAGSETAIAAEEPGFETLSVAKPTIANLQVGPPSAHTATFSAQINPNAPKEAAETDAAEQEAFKTRWHFECAPTCPGLSGGELEADDTAHEVSVEATGLTPGIPYEVSVVAENAGGTETAGPAAFQTLTAPPAIDHTFVSEVSTTEVILHAQVNPGGAATTVHFEYITQEQFEKNEEEGEDGFTAAEITPESGVIGSDNEDHEASATLEGLSPGTAYRYRALATNEAAPSGEAGPAKTFHTSAVGTGGSETCPNATFRTGPSAQLPDCRAYEMVSPVDKKGTDAKAGRGTFPELDQSSTSGQQFTYSTVRAFGDAVSDPYSSQYMASRGADGWTSHGISPPQGKSLSGFPATTSEFKAFSPDLSTAWLVDPADPPLTPDAINHYINIYQRDNTSGSYQALTTLKPLNEITSGQYFPEFQGASSDGSHAIFRSLAPLTPEAPNTESVLYEWFDGTPRLVAVLPNGEPYSGESTAGTQNEQQIYGLFQTVYHAISDNGSRIFWTAKDSGQIYVRIDNSKPDARTVAVGVGRFWTASADGSKAIFTNSVSDLYEFNVDTETPTLIAHNVSGVLGASEDASYIYFVSREDLAAGATAGEPNLYLDHGGAMSFIATLPDDTEVNVAKGTEFVQTPRPISAEPYLHTARVTPDGLHAAFVSQGSLTGYDNIDTASGKAAAEVYLYDATANGGNGKLICASCNPSGARPATGTAFFNGANSPNSYLAAASIPGWKSELYDGRVLSDNGNRVFFDSFDALVPQDTNGVQDVYEWEALGTGPSGARCTEESASFSAQDDGCLSLISTGKSPQPSELIDASPSGADVFIRTASSIDPRDPGLLDIYDARQEGGFPPPPNPAAACEGEACQTPPAPPNDPTPASSTYNGPGNVVEKPAKPCAKGKIRRHGKCVKKHPGKKHHKKAHKRHPKSNRGASR